jgi:hypothetical protein
MRCNQELYGHINCDRDVIQGEKYCKFHFVPSLRIEINELKDIINKLHGALRYYADTSIYNRPDKDRNGMGGMSAQTDFEIEDGEWKITNGEKDHYCYGKLARKILSDNAEHLAKINQK